MTSFFDWVQLRGLNYLEEALTDMRQFLETENPFKMMENAFYFTLKGLLILEKVKFLSIFEQLNPYNTGNH